MRVVLAALVVSLAASATAAAQARDDVSCVRFIQPEQHWILESGVGSSPTLRRLATALCQTDVIAYVLVDGTMRQGLAGSCALISASPQKRFLSIRLNRRLLRDIDLIATLSHELEHALQIGRAPWVREPRAVLVLQRLLSPTGTHAAGADRAEAATRRELSAARMLARVTR